MSNNTISVIIAAYNAQKSIGRAIESVLADKLVTQIIIVDDESTDRTLEISQQYQSLHSKVSVYVTGTNSGPSKARNIALQHCDSEWVTVLDSDDFVEPGRYEKLLASSTGYELIADDQFRILEGEYISTKKEMMGGAYNFPCEISLSEFIESNISQKGKGRQELGFIKPIIKREFLTNNSLIYQENMRLGEDYELYCRCLALGAKLQLIEAAGYVAVVRENSLSGKHSQYDLIQLRNCDYEMSSSLPLSKGELALFKKHALSIDIKIQWISFYSSLKQVKLINTCRALFSSFSAFRHIITQLKQEFMKRVINR